MKTTVHYRHSEKVIPFRRPSAPLYPNAAKRKDRLDKLLDYVLTAVTSAGFATALLCLITFL